MENQIKPCIKCGSTRRYPPRPGTKTGACIDCANARGRKWEHKNKERVKEVQLSYKTRNLETWKESKRKSAIKERKNNPEKTKARQEVRNAIKKEILLPVSQCACKDCGATARDYHHENYLLPLEVVPLCRSCHIKRHKDLLHGVQRAGSDASKALSQRKKAGQFVGYGKAHKK